MERIANLCAPLKKFDFWDSIWLEILTCLLLDVAFWPLGSQVGTAVRGVSAIKPAKKWRKVVPPRGRPRGWAWSHWAPRRVRGMISLEEGALQGPARAPYFGLYKIVAS